MICLVKPGHRKLASKGKHSRGEEVDTE